MSKLTIIQLLNKIANGEEVPEKFRFAGQVFKRKGSYIEDEDGDSIFDSMSTDFSNINEEIEIIEENKKIEKIDYDIEEDKFSTFVNGRFEWVDIPNTNRDLYDFYTHKINELIDEINKLKEGK